VNSGSRRIFSQNIREISIFVIMMVLSFFVHVRSGGVFATWSNLSDMFVECAILVMLSMGMMLVIVTGGIDLSAGAVMALAGMVSASVLSRNMEMSPLLVVSIGVLVGAAGGLINGVLTAYLKILPIIATLGTMNVFRGVTYLVSGGSWVLQDGMSESFLRVATGRFLGVNNLVLIETAVVILMGCFTHLYRSGRYIYAIGNSEESAAVSGIPVKCAKLTAYTILGALSGLGGVLYVCKYAAAQGETALGYEMNVIAACVLGGVSVNGGSGKFYGVLLGALLLGVLNNALPLLKVSPFWQEAVRGLIILVSVIVNAVISRRVAEKALERRAI
jgi:rhamnose transport system permease protein